MSIMKLYPIKTWMCDIHNFSYRYSQLVFLTTISWLIPILFYYNNLNANDINLINITLSDFRFELFERFYLKIYNLIQIK